MTDRQKQIEDLIEIAINDFNECEEYLISRDLSERCICSKFAMYIEKLMSQSEFGEYLVDVEYNRGARGNEYLPKRINDKQRIVVDLIVHKRDSDNTYGFQNLICIEMKKSTDRRGLKEDKERLKIMTDSYMDFKYEIGFMIVINMEQNKLEINQTFTKK